MNRIALVGIMLSALVMGAVVSGCSKMDIKPTTTESLKNANDRRKEAGGKLFGDDAFVFGGPKKNADAAGSGGSGIGVNSYLWRATLDTVTFLPVSSADPFGGVIITDWHTPPEASADERFKLNIYILGRALRADGVRVAVFRQVRHGNTWEDAPVPEGVGVKIEDTILMKARQLRAETQRQQ